MSELKQKKIAAEHPLVASIVGEPTSQERVMALSGFVGRSTKEECLRLYTTYEFDAYIELKTADVVYREDARESSSGRSLVWVKTTAELVSGTRTRGGAAFLAGDIAKQHMAPVPQPGPAPFLPRSGPYFCPSIGVCGPTEVQCGATQIYNCYTLLCPPPPFG